MSDQTTPTPATDLARPAGSPGAPVPDLGDDDVIQEDLLFKARMAVANLVLGYWRHALGVALLFLAATFIYGQVTEHRRDSQREQHAAIERVFDQLGRKIREVGATDPAAADAAAAEAAKTLEGVLADTDGVAEAYGWMRLAQIKDSIKDAEGAAAAWERAAKAAGGGPLGLSATLRSAQALQKKGEIDAAVQMLKPYAQSQAPYEAEEALFATANLYIAAARGAEARSTFDQIKLRFPSADRLEALERALPGTEG